MPSGITSDVYEGKDVSVQDYAKTVARQMGYFMHMRDDSYGEPLRYPSDSWTGKGNDSFYAKSLREIRDEKAQWDSKTEKEKYFEWSEYYRKAKVAQAEAIAKDAELRARYTKMIARVEAVDVTDEQLMESTKDNMLRYLNESLDFDCHDEPGEWYKPKEYVEWCNDKESHFARNIPRYEAELAKENERSDNLTEYIEAFERTFGVEVLPAKS